MGLSRGAVKAFQCSENSKSGDRNGVQEIRLRWPSRAAVLREDPRYHIASILVLAELEARASCLTLALVYVLLVLVIPEPTTFQLS